MGAPGNLLRALRHPRTTVRWRLTLLYGGLFLASGVALLAITYVLVAHATVSGPNFQARAVINARVPAGAVRLPPGAQPLSVYAPSATLVPLPRQLKLALQSGAGRAAVTTVVSGQRISDLHKLVIESAIALALMALLSTGLGWVVAGRVLRPLRTITATTRQISAANLEQRLAIDGPRDELRTLADTIDDLLGRLQGAFEAQRSFVAHASHELRTPLTSSRALLEMTMGDPEATVESFRSTCEQVLAEGDEQEQLIDSLLALAHGQRGIDARAPVDLATVAGDVLRSAEAEVAAHGLELETTVEPAHVLGDRRLLERLVSNLLDNAIRYNRPGGRVRLLIRDRAGQATLEVTNTGPLVPADQIERLLQPFERLTPGRVNHGDGLGLGLSIVAAVVSAHDGTLELRCRAEGGLEVEVAFPPVIRSVQERASALAS